MRRSVLAATVALLILVGAPGLPSEVERPGDDGVAPGTRGVARTVIRGHEIVEIPVEFLGRYEGAVGPGHDLYLVRLEGDEAESVGVAAGMSGSPVYVDGRVVGAISYRMGFLPKEAVAGVTPIEDMYDASRASAPVLRADPAGPAPIATPVFLGGVAGPVREMLAADLEQRGLLVVAGGGGSSDAAAGPLQPGSAVGVQLVRGDMSIAATGTVTVVEGERVYAFGHPFLGSGRVELPMVHAEVVHTLAALGGSVKLANVGAEVGAILEDRLTAVVGRSGVHASMIPIRLTSSGGDHVGRRHEFEVVRHAALTPLLAGAAVANALILDMGFDQKATVRLTGRIRLRDLPDLPVAAALTSGDGPHPFLGVSARVRTLLASLYANPFGEPEVEAVELDVDVRREQVRYVLEAVHYDRGPVSPGQSLDLRCVLRSYRGPDETRDVRVTVPASVRPGTALALAVGSPASVNRAMGDPMTRRLNSVRDLQSYVRVLGESRSADFLEVVLYRSAEGAITDGVAFTGLPPTAARLLASRASGAGASRTRLDPVARVAERLDGPLEGGVLLRIDVDGGASEPEEK